MTPNYKTLLRGTTIWREEHQGVSISLSHHAYRDGTEYEGAEPTPGTWCYYLHLTEQMFRPDDWAKLWMPERETDWGIMHDYDRFPDVDFRGGCTFYETGTIWDKHRKTTLRTVKVGCDYGHSWDRDRGYPDTYKTVLHDAKHSIDRLLEQFPDRMTRCVYSGIWGERTEFYIAVNGRTIHRSHADKFEDGWAAWRPAQEPET